MAVSREEGPGRAGAAPGAGDVRELALSLPQTSEKAAWGVPTFRVRGKIFASLSDDEESVGVKYPREEREELLAAEPDTFFIRPGHDDRYDWVRVRLAALADRSELRAILVGSWRQAAPRRLSEGFEPEG